VDEISLPSASRKTSDYGFGRGNMVAVGSVKHNVGLGGFGDQQLSTVKSAVNKVNLCVLRSDLGALVAVADECGDLKVWVGVCYGVESIASDVASRAGAGIV
jgi:hypothetical protein